MDKANSQLFLCELCDVLELPRPEPARPIDEENSYSFERNVYVMCSEGASESRKLDLYRKGCFLLEARQVQGAMVSSFGTIVSSVVRRGSFQWEEAMRCAREQAENYVRCLPAKEGCPPFVIVLDVGYCFDIFSEFTCTGGMYNHFPNIRDYRVYIDELERAEIQAMFRAIWRDPHSLDLSRYSARVTEEVAAYLANLAKLLEGSGNSPQDTEQILMCCIFTMFAENVGLIPAGSFTDILQRSMLEPSLFVHFTRNLWVAMDSGRVSAVLGRKLLRFNGNLFANPEVLPLTSEQIGILFQAAKADWKNIEPAIFGTLLERALHPKERHKLGMHYTPRAYVERLIIPTVIQPLRSEWGAVQVRASQLFNQGKRKEACGAVREFHNRLCAVRVLDPACGSGNFLYVTMEHMKRLEAEVLERLENYGDRQVGLLEVEPRQFLGLEINLRAAHIAELVLWIGYLQWHFRTYGNVAPPEPISKLDNIQNRDALVEYKRWGYTSDKRGKPIGRWDGETYKVDAMTGRLIPDERAETVDVVYEGVTEAQWPPADFVVGNPPFLGGKDKRQVLGHGMFDALTKTFKDLPASCDLVMYWWHKAAELARKGKIRRFGFITTNSITQIFSRRVVSMHLDSKDSLRIVYAIPDHPWVDASDGAAVRIAITVGEKGMGEGLLVEVVEEQETSGREICVRLSGRSAIIRADLRQGVDTSLALPLRSNYGLCTKGVLLAGSGFIVTVQEAKALGLGRIPGLERHIRQYRNGRDISDKPRGVMVIDLFDLSAEVVRNRFPDVFQWVYSRVKPTRDKNSVKFRRENWWLFGGRSSELRSAIAGLPRFIATVETSKHRFFLFLTAEVLPDNKLVNIASDDAFHLGVLSSRIHVCWALTTGGKLENRPVYVKTTCFDQFPFPDATSEQISTIRNLGEQLDAHRKNQQQLHPELTMTGMYNVLEALRSNRDLTEKERTIHQEGLVTVLRTLHDDLDAAVFDAYGWPVDLADEEVLSRLVALNASRIEEEKQGTIRWLRPEYQTKTKTQRQASLAALSIDMPDEALSKSGADNPAKPKTASKPAWSTDPVEQIQAVRVSSPALLASEQMQIDHTSVTSGIGIFTNIS